MTRPSRISSRLLGRLGILQLHINPSPRLSRRIPAPRQRRLARDPGSTSTWSQPWSSIASLADPRDRNTRRPTCRRRPPTSPPAQTAAARSALRRSPWRTRSTRPSPLPTGASGESLSRGADAGTRADGLAASRATRSTRRTRRPRCCSSTSGRRRLSTSTRTTAEPSGTRSATRSATTCGSAALGLCLLGCGQ